MNLNNIEKIIKDEKIIILYIKSKTCGVCGELLPKIQKITSIENIKIIDVFIEDHRSLGATYNIFSAPTTIMFAMGKEVYREGLFLRILDLETTIQKYKKLLS